MPVLLRANACSCGQGLQDSRYRGLGPSRLLQSFSQSIFAQNLNFGPTNTSNIATTHNPAIHAYSIIRPNHPFPSVILLNIPILFPAASMPPAFLSKPSVAALRTAVSASREVENAWEDCLRAVARERREDVRAAWVVLSDSRRGATEGVSEGRAVVVLEVG